MPAIPRPSPVTPAAPSRDPKVYYVNVITHSVQRQDNPLIGAAMTGAGYIGPYTKAEANAIAGNVPATPGGLPPAASAPGGPLQNLGGVGAIGDFFNRLTQKNTWVRVGEVIAGLMLLYVGINALMRDTAAGQAVKTAKSGAKKAVAIGAAAVPK